MAERTSDAAPIVMIVEDDELVRTVAVEYLKDHGLRVIEAVNADRALAIFGSPIGRQAGFYQQYAGQYGRLGARENCSPALAQDVFDTDIRSE